MRFNKYVSKGNKKMGDCYSYFGKYPEPYKKNDKWICDNCKRKYKTQTEAFECCE